MSLFFLLEDTNESVWLEQKLPCDDCGSSDALCINSRGWSKCFSCGRSRKVYETTEDGEVAHNKKRRSASLDDLIEGVKYTGIEPRRISAETCKKWQYGTGVNKHGERVHVANLFSVDGSLVGQKTRDKNKDFSLIGRHKKAEPLYGMHLWSGKGSKVVITEGELDALSVSEAQDNKWPVVSLPHGVETAEKSVAAAVEWLSGYEQVIIMFDNDSKGREAVEAAARVLPPGKAFVASLPLKDASEMLMAGRSKEIIQAIWNASQWRPEAVLTGADLWEKVENREGYTGEPHGIKSLEAYVPFFPRPSLVTFLAGTGSGKSTVCRQIAYNLMQSGSKIGLLMLEEDVRDTALGLMGLHAGKQLLEGAKISPEMKREAFEATVGREGVFLYDNFGSMDPEVIYSKIRFMARAGGCTHIFLDHLSIMFSGLDTNKSGVAEVDKALTALVSLAKELNICIIAVNHLKKAGEGKPYEEGAQISLQSARGSHAVAQLSYICIAFERNQQATDPVERDKILARVLKNRPFRRLGPACVLLYDHETGRLTDHPVTEKIDLPDAFPDDALDPDADFEAMP